MAYGYMLFKKKKFKILNKSVKTINGLKNRSNEILADFAAANSQFSERFPKAIIEDNKTAIGNACADTINEV